MTGAGIGVWVGLRLGSGCFGVGCRVSSRDRSSGTVAAYTSDRSDPPPAEHDEGDDRDHQAKPGDRRGADVDDPFMEFELPSWRGDGDCDPGVSRGERFDAHGYLVVAGRQGPGGPLPVHKAQFLGAEQQVDVDRQWLSVADCDPQVGSPVRQGDALGRFDGDVGGAGEHCVERAARVCGALFVAEAAGGACSQKGFQSGDSGACRGDH